MIVCNSPTMAQVQGLLALCHLPGDDIVPAYLADFLVAQEGGQDIGVAGLQVLGPCALVRSVAVHPDHRARGLGARLLAAVEQRASRHGTRQLYLLTNDAQAFFAGRGYAEVSRDAAPAELRACSQFRSSGCGAATLMTKQVQA